MWLFLFFGGLLGERIRAVVYVVFIIVLFVFFSAYVQVLVMGEWYGSMWFLLFYWNCFWCLATYCPLSKIYCWSWLLSLSMFVRNSFSWHGTAVCPFLAAIWYGCSFFALLPHDTNYLLVFLCYWMLNFLRGLWTYSYAIVVCVRNTLTHSGRGGKMMHVVTFVLWN